MLPNKDYYDSWECRLRSYLKRKEYHGFFQNRFARKVFRMETIFAIYGILSLIIFIAMGYAKMTDSDFPEFGLYSLFACGIIFFVGLVFPVMAMLFVLPYFSIYDKLASRNLPLSYSRMVAFFSWIGIIIVVGLAFFILQYTLGHSE